MFVCGGRFGRFQIVDGALGTARFTFPEVSKDVPHDDFALADGKECALYLPPQSLPFTI
jgi:hypothetical protein